MDFEAWSTETSEDIGNHKLRLITIIDGQLEVMKDSLAKKLPYHYVSPQSLARIYDRHGKGGVAERLRALLPQQKKSRSGDLCEVLATEYVEEKLSYSTPVKRLRWKDHREMAMRGDDLIGIIPPTNGARIRFLKVEAKSREALVTATVNQAREALDADAGFPTTHALTFISQRLLEIGNEELADAIDTELLNRGIAAGQVENMVFTFSGNAPDNFLKTDLQTYEGVVKQQSVGIRVQGHQDFIRSVYEQVGDHE